MSNVSQYREHKFNYVLKKILKSRYQSERKRVCVCVSINLSKILIDISMEISFHPILTIEIQFQCVDFDEY